MLARHSFFPTNIRLAGPTLLTLVCLLSICSSTPTRSTVSRNAGLRTHGVPIQDPSAGLEEISIEVMALVGTPCRYGNSTPDSGFDYSGLVHYVVQHAVAVNLPCIAAEIGRRDTSLDRRDITSGSLVFFNTTDQPSSHVGIYISWNRFVHAPATGGTMRLEDIAKSYWASRYVGIRRVVAASNLPDLPAPTASMTPAPTSPARPVDDNPLGALARARDAQTDSLISTHEPATATTPVEDDPIARFATQ